MERFLGKFEENDVLGKEEFYKLDDDSLTQIGVEHIASRFALVDEIQKLKKESEEEEEKNEEKIKRACKQSISSPTPSPNPLRVC